MGTIVQSKVIELSPGNSGNVTLDAAVTAGNALVVLATCFNSGGTAVLTVSSTIGGSAANTWATRENRQQGTNSAHAAQADNASAGTTVVTATISGSTGDRYLTAVVFEVSGVISAAFDVSIGSNGTGTAASTGTTAAKAQSDSMVLAVFSSGANNNLAAISPTFTDIYFQNSNASFEPIRAAYRNVNAAGTEAASMTLVGSDEWAAALMVLKNSAAAGVTELPALTMPPMRPPSWLKR